MLLPARMAVLNYLNKVKSANADEIMQSLKAQYGKEGQFNHNAYVEHLMALEANGLASLSNYDIEENDTLVLYYEITEDGRSSVEKYIPKRFR